MSGKEEKGMGRKLAVLLITTHGNLDTSIALADDGKSITGENIITHDGKINVHKINATTAGVCNWTSPTSLNEMIGQRMNGYIKDNKKEESEDCKRKQISYNQDNILCLYGTDIEQQRQIFDFSRSLASFIPTIDDVRDDTIKYVKKTAKDQPATLVYFDENSRVDPELHRYIEQLPDSYQLEKWGTGALYSDKIYTIIRSELVGEEVSAFDNTMVLLGDDSKLPLPDMPIGPTSRSKTKGDDITFNLSHILAKLKELEYTDTIIIDLSCNAAYTEAEGRRLRREYSKNQKSAGGKKTKRKRKKPSKKKRKPKRTRKHRKK